MSELDELMADWFEANASAEAWRFAHDMAEQRLSEKIDELAEVNLRLQKAEKQAQWLAKTFGNTNCCIPPAEDCPKIARRNDCCVECWLKEAARQTESTS